MWWKMTLFCKIFRALNHLTFSMHFNFWEMQVLSLYQDDTHLSVTNFKSNPPLAQQTLKSWDEGSSSSVLNCDKIDISQFHMPSENFSTHQSVNFQFLPCIQMHSMIYKYPNPMKRLSNDTNIYFRILHFHTWTDVWEEISNFMQSKETTWQLIEDIHDKMII